MRIGIEEHNKICWNNCQTHTLIGIVRLVSGIEAHERHRFKVCPSFSSFWAIIIQPQIIIQKQSQNSCNNYPNSLLKQFKIFRIHTYTSLVFASDPWKFIQSVIMSAAVYCGPLPFIYSQIFTAKGCCGIIPLFVTLVLIFSKN